MPSENFHFATVELLEKLKGVDVRQQIISTSQNLFNNWVFYITFISILFFYAYLNLHRILGATNLLECDNYDEDTCPSNVCEWKNDECGKVAPQKITSNICPPGWNRTINNDVISCKKNEHDFNKGICGEEFQFDDALNVMYKNDSDDIMASRDEYEKKCNVKFKRPLFKKS